MNSTIYARGQRAAFEDRAAKVMPCDASRHCWHLNDLRYVRGVIASLTMRGRAGALTSTAPFERAGNHILRKIAPSPKSGAFCLSNRLQPRPPFRAQLRPSNGLIELLEMGSAGVGRLWISGLPERPFRVRRRQATYPQRTARA